MPTQKSAVAALFLLVAWAVSALEWDAGGLDPAHGVAEPNQCKSQGRQCHAPCQRTGHAMWVAFLTVAAIAQHRETGPGQRAKDEYKQSHNEVFHGG